MPAPLLTLNTSNDVVSRKDVHSVGPENKSLRFDPIFPKNVDLGEFFDGTKNFSDPK